MEGKKIPLTPGQEFTIKFRLVAKELPAYLNLVLPTETMGKPIPGHSIQDHNQDSFHIAYFPPVSRNDLNRLRQNYFLKIQDTGGNSESLLQIRLKAPVYAALYEIKLDLQYRTGKRFRKKIPLEVKAEKISRIHCQLKSDGLYCAALDLFGNLVHSNASFELGRYGSKIRKKVFLKQGRYFINLPDSFKYPARFIYSYSGREFLSNALPKERSPIFFGDLHTHSCYSDARYPARPTDLFLYGRNVSFLDFMAVTDHAEGVWGNPLRDYQWAKTVQAVQKLNQPGKFTTFLGFEWTSGFEFPSDFGHRTIIYPSHSGKPYRADLESTSTPEKLYSKAGRVFSFVHHSKIAWGAFKFNRPLLKPERNVEIYSSHGSCEHAYIEDQMRDIEPEGAVSQAMEKGYKISLLASSDSHGGHPGLNDWKGLTPDLMDSGGLIALYAPGNSRKELFNALEKGRFYATSGTRIMLYPSSRENPFPMEIQGSGKLSHAMINARLDDGSIKRVRIELGGSYEAVIQYLPDPGFKTYYLTIYQFDGEKAWIGFFNRPRNQSLNTD